MKVKIVDINGKETGKEVTLPKEIFGVEPNDHAIWLAVRQFQAHNRQGTSKTKERAEIKGSTKKIRRQKGTGGARFGDIKNPIFRGGGRVFGPRPRNYGFKLNKKVKAIARNSALAYKAKEKQVIVVEDFNLEQPKTKEFANILNKLGAGEERALVLLAEKNDNIYLSSRNLPNTQVSVARQLNTHDVLRAKKLVLAESALKEIAETF